MSINTPIKEKIIEKIECLLDEYKLSIKNRDQNQVKKLKDKIESHERLLFSNDLKELENEQKIISLLKKEIKEKKYSFTAHKEALKFRREFRKIGQTRKEELYKRILDASKMNYTYFSESLVNETYEIIKYHIFDYCFLKINKNNLLKDDIELKLDIKENTFMLEKYMNDFEFLKLLQTEYLLFPKDDCNIFQFKLKEKDITSLKKVLVGIQKDDAVTYPFVTKEKEWASKKDRLLNKIDKKINSEVLF